MKRLLILAISLLSLSGCGNGQTNTSAPQIKEQKQTEPAFSSLPADDVIEVASSSEIGNLNRFYKFLENIEAKEADHIQIRRFTTEGDPISRDIQFDGSVFQFIFNSSRDQYGAEAVCDELTRTETVESTDYQLEGCESDQVNSLLTVWK
ncbi:DUF4362 domain-containing protein [Planococcus beigongshangi]|uniref:DUF4362 domain-containing protein n=1 Tax=Planococcus beigongshangi TaxID=2782536 RepID=UPI00193B0426|nr:DUF4362 domain-containing protein [Planococcus beigongshangi]